MFLFPFLFILRDCDLAAHATDKEEQRHAFTFQYCLDSEKKKSANIPVLEGVEVSPD